MQLALALAVAIASEPQLGNRDSRVDTAPAMAEAVAEVTLAVPVPSRSSVFPSWCRRRSPRDPA